MTTITQPRDEKPGNLDEVTTKLTEPAVEYAGVSLTLIFVRSDIIKSSKLKYFSSDEEQIETWKSGEEPIWINAMSKAIFEKEEKEYFTEQPVDHTQLKVHKEFISTSGLIDILQQIKTRGRFDWNGREIWVTKPGDEVNIKSGLKTSDHTSYDHFSRGFSTYNYNLIGDSFSLEYRGESIDYGTTPSPLGLEQVQPPLLNVYDAIEKYLGWDGTRIGGLNNFYVFQPYYKCKITNHDLETERDRLVIELDRYAGKVNDVEDLSLNVVNGLGDPDIDLRLSPDIDSHHIDIDLGEVVDGERIPSPIYILLLHEGTVVDMRRISLGQSTSPLFDEAEAIFNTHPFIAGATARMALLQELREMCEEAAIQYDEDDKTDQLRRKLIEEEAISGTENSLLDHVIDVFSKAAHLQKDEIDEDDIRKAMDQASAYFVE